jgi:serine/threonine protein kinase
MPIALKAGEVLRARYKIQERIGQGGMGNIYRADDLRLEGRQCALKEVEYERDLPPHVLNQAREQFLREATILARLDHPNLPKVSDFFSSSQRDYLVMDYVPGKDLRDHILEARRKRVFLPESEVLRWSAQLADALSYLHHQDPPIIHRDIKPSNLKITPNGVLKLVDFGLVKIMAPEEVTITIIQGQGTALYTPLEQYGSDDTHTDVRTDIYSFGATLYHLLTNEPPADARKRFLDSRNLLPPREINPSLSPRSERAVLWAMSLHPDDRPASIHDFREALLGRREIPSQPIPGLPAFEAATLSRFLTPLEAIIGYTALGLFIIGLIVTLTR